MLSLEWSSKGIWSTWVHRCSRPGEKNVRKFNMHLCVCVCVYGHILRLTWLCLGSLRYSGKGFFAAPWKSSREERLKRGQKSKAHFFSPEDWLFFVINMHSSCVTSHFPLKYSKRLHERKIKTDKRRQQIGLHIPSVQQNAGENIVGKRHGKFPQPELMNWISTKHLSHKVKYHMVTSTGGRKTASYTFCKSPRAEVVQWCRFSSTKPNTINSMGEIQYHSLKQALCLLPLTL